MRRLLLVLTLAALMASIPDPAPHMDEKESQNPVLSCDE